MRRLHPVAAQERFLGSGSYHFSIDGRALDKCENWSLHELPDGERIVRVDMDARREEGRSILLHGLQTQDGGWVRLDIRYDGAAGSALRSLRASYQIDGCCLRVGYSMNSATREYEEMTLPADTLIDMPLLLARGAIIPQLAGHSRPVYVPMFELAQLLPGRLQQSSGTVLFDGHDTLRLGAHAVQTRRFRYTDRVALYWIDRQDVIVQRLTVRRGQELRVQLRNYAAPVL